MGCHDLMSNKVVAPWLENPYWQIFIYETHLQTEPPIDPSSLSRWRRRLGEAGVEEMLAPSIEAAKRTGVIKASSARRVIVDTTVMPKAIAYPTDSALLERSRARLVKMVQQTWIGTAAELQPYRARAGATDWTRCPCQAIQAHAFDHPTAPHARGEGPS